MSDDHKFHASDSLLAGRGYTPDYGINQSISPSGSYEASEKVPRPSAIQTALESHGSERIWVVAMCSLIACLASVVNGMMLGFSSPALSQLQSNVTPEYQISNTDIKYSLFGALSPVGAMFGGLVAWPISDLLGRRTALMMSGVPALAGWLMIALAHLIDSNVRAFYGVLLTGRTLTGFSSGWSIFCVSVYISEIASAKLKGLFGNCNQLFITIGIFISYFFGIEYSKSDGTYFSVKYWEIALVAAGIVAIFEFLMLFTYETPRWLLSKQKEDKAVRTLSILRGPNFHISRELEKMRVAVRRTYSVTEQLMEFKHRSIFIPFLLVLMLMFFQQFSGINVAIFYASQIFLEAGLTDRMVNLIVAVAIGIVQMIATLACVVLVDCAGRKILLTVSSTGMALSSLVLGIYFYVYNNTCGGCLIGDTNNPKCDNTSNTSIVYNKAHQQFPCNTANFGYLAVACIVVFIISFSLAWGPIPWSSMSELMPNRVRTLAGSIATFVNWMFATIITLCFKYYSRPPINNDGAWWTFSFVMFVAIVVVILFLPETKGHSLEEIQEHFEKGEIFAVSCPTRRRRASPSSSTDSYK